MTLAQFFKSQTENTISFEPVSGSSPNMHAFVIEASSKANKILLIHFQDHPRILNINFTLLPIFIDFIVNKSYLIDFNFHDPNLSLNVIIP